MSWSLESTEDGIFLLINGLRALDTSGTECASIENVKPGRTATEIWIQFSGKKNGKRLDRTRYQSTNGYLTELENSPSNSFFVEKLRECGVGSGNQPNTTRSRKRKRPEMPDTFNLEGPEDTDVPDEVRFVEGKFVGQFEVELKRLQVAPANYRSRSFDNSWIEKIKDTILNSPGGIVTVFPVMLDPSISDPGQFKEEHLLEKPLYTLGGNHAIQAMKQAIEEEPTNAGLNRYNVVRIDLYVGLSTEEGQLLANMHNKRTLTKKVFFQDLIKQARSIFKSAGDDWREAVVPIVNQIQESNKNHSVLLRVIAYPDNLYHEIERIIELWNISQPMEEMPQKIFKSLSGLSHDVSLAYLKKISTVADINKIAKDIDRGKKTEVLQRIFMERTGCSTWEEACDTFEDISEKLDQFQGLNITKKSIPKVLLDFIDDIKENRQTTTDLAITISLNHDLKDHPAVVKIIGQHKMKLQEHLLKVMRNISEE